MTAIALLLELRHRGVSIAVNGNELDVSAPKGVLDSELRVQLARHKLELIRVLREGSNVLERIPRLERGGGERVSFIASFAQQRLWFLHQLFPDKPIYNMPIALRLKGKLDVQALQACLDALVARHETLRTTFRPNGVAVLQVINRAEAVALAVVDLTAVPESEHEAEARRRVTAEALRPFDLTTGPLFRAQLLRLSAADHLLQLTMHHIISDGWSIPVLFRDIGALYQASRNGEAPQLPELLIQYADYSVWQRSWLSGAVLSQQLDYWRGRLEGLSELQLPTDYSRPALPTFRGAHKTLSLSPRLSAALRSLSQRNGATLYMTLLAAFNVLLQRYTRQDDIVIGSPISNRTRAELEELIGFFVNNLVMRTDLSGDPSFAELLGRVRRVALDAYAHQDLPFERLVEELEPRRDLSRNPLFQVTFSMQNATAKASSRSETSLRVENLPTGIRTIRFDLEVDVWEAAEQLRVDFFYAADLFDAETLHRMLGQYERLLEGVVADPQCRISELPLLTDPERRQQLIEWNATEVAYPAARCVHEWVEEQARVRPEALAVRCGAAALSYGELEARAQALAGRLRERGVGTGSLVAVYLERSVEMVVALLAVWKAGGAYVPIDPEYPPERVRLMLEDAGALVVLTQDTLAAAVPVTDAAILSLNAKEGPRAPSRGRLARRAPLSPQSLAYVIYTSGSTGQPKGVAITHASLCNLIHWHQQAYGLTPADRATQIAGLGFDASVWELWPYLTAGASVHLPDEATRLDAGALVRWLAEERITLAFLPTPLAEAALRESWPQTTPLRVLLTGGDRLNQRPTQKLPFRLVNHYGPTENTVVSTCAEVEPGGTGAPPIGRPLPNTRAYVVDAQLSPVPVGVPGELLVGGVQLAEGYWNQPELTAEKFVPDPFRAGERVYRTGDLVRYLADGTIEFLGRVDSQVKVRGYRIELGEIESALSAHPAVRETVVLAREDSPGDKRLVAYVVAPGAPADLVEQLRAHIRSTLPEYMVPAAFLSLAMLPLTPNGKVDRRALPAPEYSGAEAAYVAPRTATEEVLAGIWAEVLKLKRVGIHDNFFELGGDSILSFQVIAKAKRAGLQLRPKQIFEHQRLAELAAVAEKIASHVPDQGLVTGDVPLTPIQHWFFEQNFVDPHHWNQAMWLELRQGLDPSLLVQAIQLLVIHHDALRMRFRRSGTGWKQFNAGADETQWLTRVDLSGLNEAEKIATVQRAAAELQGQLNLAEGPLLRAGWFDFGRSQPTRFLIVIHHLVVDTVSWRILSEDLQTVCQQLRLGNAVRLPDKTTSFRRWAHRLTEYACSIAIERQRDYWLSFSHEGTGRLPVDFSKGENTGLSARTVSASLDVEETRALIRQVPHAYATQMNDVLLCALAMALGRWTGQSTACIHLEGHGREELFEGVDLSRSVGWFTTLFPVRLDLGGSHEVGDRLKSIKEQLRRIPQRGIGFGLLRYSSGNEEIGARLRALPQPEVVFNYLGQFDHDQTLSADAVFTEVNEPTGPVQNLRARRSGLLTIIGLVANGRLQLRWTYSENAHRRTTIENLASNFMEALRGLIRHCTSQVTEPALLFPKDKVHNNEFDNFKKKKIELSDAIKMLGLG